MTTPNVPKAVAQLDALIAEFSMGAYKSSYEGQLLDKMRDVRKTLDPQPPLSVTISFAIDRAEVAALYDLHIGKADDADPVDMLTGLLLEGFQRLTSVELTIVTSRGEQV